MFRLKNTAALFSGLLLAQGVMAADLVSVLQQAEKSDPQLKAAEQTLMAASQSIPGARAAFLPQINASYNISRGSQEQEMAGMQFGDLPDIDTESWSINLNQTIYNRRNYVQMDTARAKLAQGEAAFEQARQDFYQRVAERYFAVLTEEDNLRFAEAEQKAIGRQLEQARQRFEVGLAAITDVHETQASFDASRAATILATNQLDDAYEALAEITGMTQNDFKSLRENLALSAPEPVKSKDWVQFAMENSPDLAYVMMQEKLAENQLDNARAGHWPTLSLNASVSESTNNNAYINDVQAGVYGPFESVYGSNRVSLVLDIPIYSGGSTTSQSREAGYQLEAAQQQLDRARRDVVRKTRNAFRGTQASMLEVEARKQAVVSAQSALDATQAGFEVGTRTIVDVLFSQRTLYQAQRDYSRARHNFILNQVRLKRAAGVLKREDLLEINKLLES